jgi:hypothetical protein
VGPRTGQGMEVGSACLRSGHYIHSLLKWFVLDCVWLSIVSSEPNIARCLWI